MTERPDAQRLIPMLLVISALVMGALAMAFWVGAIDVGDSGRLVAAAIGLAAVFELGVALYLQSRLRS